MVSTERREVRGRSRCHRHINGILVIGSQCLARHTLVITVRGIVGDKGDGLVAGHRQHGHINRSGCCRTADGIGIGTVADRKTRDVAGDLRTSAILDFELTDSQLVLECNARQGKYTAAFGHIARTLGIVQSAGERSEGAVLHTQGTEVRCPVAVGHAGRIDIVYTACHGVCQRDGNLSGLTTVGDITRLEGTAYGLYPFAAGIRIDDGNLLALVEGLHTLLCQGTRSSTPIHTDGGGQGDRF